MGETNGVTKRRVFPWSKEATELVRQYKQGTNRCQEHTEIGRRKLVTKLAAGMADLRARPEIAQLLGPIFCGTSSETARMHI
jgi:hypothetical protein